MSDRRKTALVTGASYGIGAGSAIELAIAGFDVAVTDLQRDTLDETVTGMQKAGASTAAIELDLRDPASIEAAFDEAVAHFGQIDVLVNNAGIPAGRKDVLDVTLAEWDEGIRVNLTGTFLMSQHMGRHLIGGGREGAIVNISSAHGLVAFASASVYGITKAGINQLTRALAIEWAPHGIRVNAIAPGPTETKTRAAFHADPEQRARTLGRVPLGRYGEVSDVANAVRYLASSESGFVTGHVLVVDGGVTAQ